MRMDELRTSRKTLEGKVRHDDRICHAGKVIRTAGWERIGIRQENVK
jgi:hypothetical protein